MKITGKFLLIILLITSCSPSPEALATQTAGAWTLTPESTATPAPEPIIGKLFWDANGSGLQDETSFIVPEVDLQSPHYFFELLAANGTGLDNRSHGELANVPEPPIPGMQVCLGEFCTETDADGTFTLQPNQVHNTYQLTFKDPNADDPEKAFRYINKWNGPVVIESYEINGVTVPEQRLNDTKVIEIDRGISISLDKEIKIGLMQGSLTLPYLQEDQEKWILSNYVDLDIRNGYVRTYNNITNMNWNRFGDPLSSNDQHYGLDFFAEEGLFVICPNSGRMITYMSENGSLGAGIKHFYDLHSSMGHFSLHLIKINVNVSRGQIIASNGKTGTTYPHIHWHLVNPNIYKNDRPIVIDPFGDEYSHGDESIEVYEYHSMYPEGQAVVVNKLTSEWTVYNIPQFPLAKVFE